MGARIYLGVAAQAAYAFTPLHDGDILEFGRVRLKVLETPGHTPESISIVVYDLDEKDNQIAHLSILARTANPRNCAVN